MIIKTAGLNFVDNQLPSPLTDPRQQEGNEEGARCELILKLMTASDRIRSTVTVQHQLLSV